jgi:hypothetical protein
MSRKALTPALLAGFLASSWSMAATPPPPFGGLPTNYGYVTLTDMALVAPIVIAADIVDAIPIKDAAGVPAGKARYYVQAQVKALISGKADLPLNITYQVDIPADPQGKKRKLKGVPVLLLAATTPTAGMLRLVGPNAQVPRTGENEARLRAILAALIAPDAPPAITGVTRAFHVQGSLPGESETQIFLRTSDSRPISLNILRRPGEKPRWAVALTELVDDSAAPPKPESLLWYRLACGLPRALPDAAIAEQAPADASAARADYAVVLSGLGPCRTE